MTSGGHTLGQNVDLQFQIMESLWFRRCRDGANRLYYAQLLPIGLPPR